MKLTILVILVVLFIFFCSFQAPSLFFIGYLWISILYPSAFITLPIPFSFLYGLCCIGAFIFFKREKLGSFPTLFYIAIGFAIWVTCTTAWAVDPNAWSTKGNWAFQSILITMLVPIFLRTRTQLEMGLIATLSAFSAHVLTAGAKSIVGTAGYDRLGTLIPFNFFLGETSTLALVAILSIPMAGYVVRHSIIFERFRGKYLNGALAVYTVFALMCVVGTSARTGIVALGVLLLIGIKSVVRRVVVLTCAALFLLYGQALLPERSLSRFSTIDTYQKDLSAETRIAAWKWAMGYVSEHPFGGGFNIFNKSEFDTTTIDDMGVPITIHEVGRAAHSVYFEVLGEQGYVGELLFLLLIAGGLWGTYRLSKKSNTAKEGDWSPIFARTLWVCITIFCAGSAFIGMAFEPILYIFLGLYCSLYRITRGPKSTRVKFSARAAANATPA